MIIDTHCHYNLKPLVDDWRGYWQAAQAAGVVGSIIVGTSVETSKTGLDIAGQEQNLFVSLGIHPTESGRSIQLGDTQSLQQAINELRKLSTSPKVIAIGECGLDYFRLTDQREQEIELQHKMLEEQLTLAEELRLPIVIHLRDSQEDAYRDFLKILKRTATRQQSFILHCVSGPIDFIQECVSLGAYIGVAGNVSYPNSGRIREIVTTVPADRILVETDAPFLPPQVSRGKTCEPQMIQWTVEYISTEFGYSPEKLLKNTIALFPQFKSIYETK
ncbi:MAG: TatD DNase family protein [Patescibacteria group bacterium]|nr:TatD DNase family protein [Patescibacteria group bacterium]